VATTHAVTLTIGANATEIDVWDQYTITLSMLRAGQPWTFSMWRSTTRQATWDVLNRTVKLFDRVTVSVDGHPQLTGRIEAFERHADGHGECVAVISGRDLAGPAQSWDADPTVQIKDTPLDEALQSIFDPLGLTVRVTSGAAARIVQTARSPGARPSTTRRRRLVDRSHPRPGEKVWSLAQSMARRLGYLLWVAPRTDGTVGIVVDVPDYEQQPSYLFERRLDGTGRGSGNILAGAEAFSVRDVPTDVTVYTGSTRGAAVSSRSRSVSQNAALYSGTVTRGFALDTLQAQPRHMKSDRARTLQAAQKEGERVIADAMQDFYRYTATVQGHGQTVGGTPTLYAVNTIARVRDDLLTDSQGRPLDAALYVTDVEMAGSRKGGQTTRLTMVPTGSIVVTPET
jgi:prophage tail gpP-like protein